MAEHQPTSPITGRGFVSLKTNDSGVRLYIKTATMYIILIVLGFLCSLQSPMNIWTRTAPGRDSSVFRYIGKAVLAGQMPYKDTFDHKGPLLYIINACGLYISDKWGVWLLEFLTIVATFIIMYRIAQLICKPWTSILITVLCSSLFFAFFEGGNLTEEYAMPFIALAIYIFLDYFINQQISNIRLVLCGIGMGAVLLLRINMIAIWVVMCIGVVVLSLRGHKGRQLLTFSGFFLLGCLMVLLPVMCWLQSGGALQAFFSDYIVFNMRYSSFTSKWEALRARSSVFIFFSSRALVLLSSLIVLYRAAKKKQAVDCLYIIYLIVCLYFMCVSGQEYAHYGMVLIPGIVYPLALAFQDSASRLDTARIAVAAYLVLILVIPPWFSGLATATTSFINRGQDNISDIDKQIATTVQDNSKTSDRILVCGNWNNMYLLSDRLAASIYSYQDPITQVDPTLSRDFYKGIDAEKPKLIVLSEGATDYKKLSRFVQQNRYEKVGDTVGGVIVYKLS